MSKGNRQLLRRAIELARLAREHGNHPFGALLVDAKGNVVLEAENTVRTDKDVTAHAETNLMRLATARFDRDFLGRCTLYTSTEPCAMCAGALVHARIKRLVYGADDPKAGAVHSVMQVLNDSRLNHHMEVRAGVLAGRSAELLQAFFRKRR